MTDSAFTQGRADEIVQAARASDVATFTSAVAFAGGVTPTASAVAGVNFPADFAIDAASFAGSATRGKVTATGGGQQANLLLIKHEGAWKIDSTGSDASITEPRKGA